MWEVNTNAENEIGNFIYYFISILHETYYVSSQKKLLKINGFEGSISDVDLGLFQPNNQIMFSFLTFWFC